MSVTINLQRRITIHEFPKLATHCCAPLTVDWMNVCALHKAQYNGTDV